ncbi:MAG: YdcH family protein [Hyphomicrobiales bacterium]|nr:YdcH family protein [Hyphomicrobiales bacterium]
MSHTPHELAEEFPDRIEEIHNLKLANTHFSKLVDEYHTVNRDIHRAETNIEPTDDFNMETMRKNRMHLKDEIYSMLSS